MRRLLPLLAVTGLAVSACGSPAPTSSAGSTAPAAAPAVVVTTTILGDIAGTIARCGGATADVLMPAGADPHDFAPSSRQVAAIADADLVVANGLGLEAALGRALASAAEDGATVLEIGPLVDPIPFGEGGHGDGHADEHADEHGHGALDPHIWFDMARMARAAELIGDALAERTGDEAFRACGQQEAEAIRASDARVRALLDSVPAGQRILVTDHDALGYLASAYGYEIAGSVVPAGTTMAEPSSADLAALADQLRTEGVRAIFTNAAQPSDLSAALAAEVGGQVAVVPLHVESLGAPGTPAATYTGMMEENAATIAQALGGKAS